MIPSHVIPNPIKMFVLQKSNITNYFKIAPKTTAHLNSDVISSAVGGKLS